jgi:hypothetical protein
MELTDWTAPVIGIAGVPAGLGALLPRTAGKTGVSLLAACPVLIIAVG